LSTLALILTGVAGGGVGGGGLDTATFVAGHGFVGLVEFEVGRRRIEEQEIHFKVEEAGDLPEDLLLQLWGHLVEPVHGPVAGVIGGLGESVDVHPSGDPAGGGELARRVQRPVGDQREQHPLGERITAGAGQHAGHIQSGSCVQ
jgi:hypothetical protein